MNIATLRLEQEISLSAAHNATTPVLLLVTLGNTCGNIRTKNPLAARSVTSIVDKLLTSNSTCSHIQERSLSSVTSVTILAVRLKI